MTKDKDLGVDSHEDKDLKDVGHDKRGQSNLQVSTPTQGCDLLCPGTPGLRSGGAGDQQANTVQFRRRRTSIRVHIFSSVLMTLFFLFCV